jgi:cobalt-precorrin-5B (C1)-methyltransferase
MKGGRTGFTTGTCAAAATKAAVMVLADSVIPDSVEVMLPTGSEVKIPIEEAGLVEGGAMASVRKDAGDDPDVTDGCIVQAYVEWASIPDVELLAGEGVGTVTKPGLAVPPGRPAINPTPRTMIINSAREITSEGLRITISIPGGRELAEKTFNPRLGVIGGLSILGTSGIVRPFSVDALKEALKCSLDVAVACGVKTPVLVPGRIGEKAARNLLVFTPQQLIEVSNEWGFILDKVAKEDFAHLLVLGHPGKLGKLAAGWWNTHSSHSGSAVPTVMRLYQEAFDKTLPEPATVEAIFSEISQPEIETLAGNLAREIRVAVENRLEGKLPVTVVLVNLQSRLLSKDGDLSPWQ